MIVIFNKRFWKAPKVFVGIIKENAKKKNASKGNTMGGWAVSKSKSDSKKSITFNRLWQDVVAGAARPSSSLAGGAVRCQDVKEVGKVQQKVVLKARDYQVSLTRRESETLLLITYGYTVPESAHFLGLSSRTVELYVVKLRHKFQCKSKRELIDQVIADGLLLQLRCQVRL